MHKKLLFVSKTKLVFAAGLMLAASVLGGTMYHAPKALAACDRVNIVYCGLTGSDAAGYISSVKKLYNDNRDTLGNTDIRTMLAWGGYSSSVISGLNTTNTKVGTLYRDGHIVVDGRTVATKTWLTARFNGGSGFYQVKDGVWKRLTTTSMTNSSDKVLITFDSAGKAVAGIVIHCGNTIKFTASPPPAPTVRTSACTGLTAAVLDATKYQYRFTAKYTNSNTTFKSATFDFGDTTKATVTTGSNGTVTTDHAYAKSGTYKVNATLTFDAGGTTQTKTCSTQVATVVPYGKCVQLNATSVDNKLKYTFKATMTYGNGAVFQGADFDFGDGKKATGVTTATADTVSVDHEYAKTGTYSASAVLRFSIDGTQYAAPTCYVKISPDEPPAPECKPGIPVGDDRCTPCEYDVNLPANDERCKVPVLPETTTLPNTGAGNVVLLSLAALVGGFLFYRHRVFEKHKRDFVAAEEGTSPLPLADPMSSHPLDGTPLDQAVRSTLRRRRQF